ncbi:MFS transporter [Aromatoleum toluclasticum]|uniref:MFS transporter n=1 Tax=Aromatoleum toluclasticum TaxID=92003 RepID=UPI001D1854B3|nr:MFS transporter [Aromatoleum toluclasticum]MCC4114959.1 MFS transporter [Aromatoleum toluclasticum]
MKRDTSPVADVGPPASATVIDPWAPLRRPVFRLLWITALTANICSWMFEVAAAWTMATMPDSTPLLVALVQTAATAPVFLLALPSGALADIIDRRRYLIFSQCWVTAASLLAGVLAVSGALTGRWLFFVAFLMGCGLAMRLPTYQSLMQEVVPRDEIAGAVVLNGVALNSSRAVGPVIAGAIVASAGAGQVFLLNALLSAVAVYFLLRWRRDASPASNLPSERFIGAIRVGIQFALHTPALLAVLARGAVCSFFGGAPLVLLPVVAKNQLQAGPTTYSLLVSCFGLGALVLALVLGRVRRRVSRDQLLASAWTLSAAATAVVGLSSSAYAVGAAMVAGGFGWMAAFSAFQVAAQMALPRWVGGRGLALVLMALWVGMAFGGAVWGQLATKAGVATSLLTAAVTSLVGLAATWRLKLDGHGDGDLTPSPYRRAVKLAVPLEPAQGPVMVTVEYLIDPGRAVDFLKLMQASRRTRLRNGAMSWAIFRDVAHAGRYVEQFIDENWLAHLRHRERVTAAERAIENRKLAFHVGERPPLVKAFVGADVPKGPG